MTVKPNIHVWLVSGFRTPDRHHGFRYAEPELRLPLHRTGITASTTPNGVHFPFSDLLYKQVSPPSMGSPVPSLYCRISYILILFSFF
jgi:hypothetical protein